VREILLAIEAHPPGQGSVDVQVPSFSPEAVSDHVRIMAEAGLIEALNPTTMQNFSWNPPFQSSPREAR